MALWLFKEEPTHYSFADLRRDGGTLWEGVRNALALKHLGQVRAGDRILYYHTGKEKAVVGEMKAVHDALTDPDDRMRTSVEVAPVRPLPRPVPLARIKQEPALADWELVRMPRLSVMPVTPEQWRRIEELSSGPGEPAA
jgi:predicted RNA-binding protein with PUA-like domain